MALEGGDDRAHRRVEVAGDRLLVAVERQHRLQGLDRLAGVAHGEEAAIPHRRRRHPVPDAFARQPLPGKVFARILLACRRHVGMGEHTGSGDRAPDDDVAGQRDDRGNLRFRIGRQPAGMAGMSDLDADGAGVDVAHARPGSGARVPGPVGLRHHLHDASVLEHEVMGRDLGGRVAQALQRTLRRRHARVVQDQHVRALSVFPLPVIG
jgi:hypothetical protein